MVFFEKSFRRRVWEGIDMLPNPVPEGSKGVPHVRFPFFIFMLNSTIKKSTVFTRVQSTFSSLKVELNHKNSSSKNSSSKNSSNLLRHFFLRSAWTSQTHSVLKELINGRLHNSRRVVPIPSQTF